MINLNDYLLFKSCFFIQQMAGIDSRELMSDQPEAQLAQMQTLQDILSEAQDDEVFQTILKKLVPRQVRRKKNALRRFNQLTNVGCN